MTDEQRKADLDALIDAESARAHRIITEATAALAEYKRQRRNAQSRASKYKAQLRASWAADDLAAKEHADRMTDAIREWRDTSDSNEGLYQQALNEGYTSEEDGSYHEFETNATRRWNVSRGQQISAEAMSEVAYDWALAQGVRSRLGLD